jgi:diguanylate cyclase (GGDEF)-like protein/PAS domain S-box-containing protein
LPEQDLEYSSLPNNVQSAPIRVVPGTTEDLLHAFLEHVPDGVYFKDRESRFVRISRSLAHRFGLSDPAEAIGKTDSDVFRAEHAQQALADEQNIIRTGEPIVEKEEKETWPDGHETWVLTTKLPLTNVDGVIIGTMGISRDITERKRIEQELHEHRLHLEELVAKRTVELQRAKDLLERDVAARKLAEQELAQKANELALANAELENLSLVDDLTGLYNRKGFLALAHHRVKMAQRAGEPFFVAFVDLDDLKQINDKFGHQAGNCALVDAANVLKQSFRDSDILARLGGDEFAVFIAEADDQKITRRILHNLAAHNDSARSQYCLSFSMGIVPGVSSEGFEIEALLAQADALMYQQKRQKRSARKTPMS